MSDGSDLVELFPKQAREAGIGEPGEALYEFMLRFAAQIDRFDRLMTPKAQEQLIEQVTDTLDKRIKRWEADWRKAFHWRTLAIGAAAAIGLSLAAYTVGWASGDRYATKTWGALESALDGHTEAAATWIGLVKANDVEAALAASLPGRDAKGRPFLWVPIWVDQMKRPAVER